MGSFYENSFVDDTWVNFNVDQIENSTVSFRDTMTESEEVSLDWSHLTSQNWSRRSENEINHDQTLDSGEDFCQNDDSMFEDGDDFEYSEYDDQESGENSSTPSQSHSEHRTRHEHVISEDADQNIASLIWGDSDILFDLNLSVSSSRNRNTGNHNDNFMLVPDSTNQVRS